MAPRPRKPLDEKSSDYSTRFALNLRKQLDKRKIGQTAFLEALKHAGLEVSTQTVGKWISGDRLPRCYDLEFIGEALGLRDYRQVLPPPK